MTRPLEERFWALVDKKGPTECWNWKGSTFESGYGQFKVAGRNLRVHRFAFELLKHEIPDGLTIDHLCRNRRCVNPDHLEAVEIKINILRSPFTLASINKSKTHCKRGHEFIPENIIWVPGGRSCKRCQRARERQYQRKEGC